MEALVTNKSIFIFLLLFCNLVCAELISGRVVAISDGDTITVLDRSNTPHKIRLMGIDAPEKSQSYGNISKSNLSDLIYLKSVEVVWEKKDRYNRIIGKVNLNNIDICLQQIRSGLAWHYKKYAYEQNSADRTLYSEAENSAKLSKLGLWKDMNPVPPWDFRHK
jgi:endonuclease YncB( thermonuclease family)